jgi:isocitrate lyase
MKNISKCDKNISNFFFTNIMYKSLNKLQKKEHYIQIFSIMSIEKYLKTIVGMRMIFMGGWDDKKTIWNKAINLPTMI